MLIDSCSFWFGKFIGLYFLTCYFAVDIIDLFENWAVCTFTQSCAVSGCWFGSHIFFWWV